MGEHCLRVRKPNLGARDIPEETPIFTTNLSVDFGYQEWPSFVGPGAEDPLAGLRGLAGKTGDAFGTRKWRHKKDRQWRESSEGEIRWCHPDLPPDCPSEWRRVWRCSCRHLGPQTGEGCCHPGWKMHFPFVCYTDANDTNSSGRVELKDPCVHGSKKRVWPSLKNASRDILRDLGFQALVRP